MDGQRNLDGAAVGRVCIILRPCQTHKSQDRRAAPGLLDVPRVYDATAGADK
ncbi:MAG: hypothetical protein ABSE73_22210 [Planctomycetota bacterium]